MRSHRLGRVLGVAACRGGFVAFAALAAAAQPPGTTDSSSRIDCTEAAGGAQTCEVDLETYIGWRVFDRFCASCHAQDARGSRFAPDLLHRIRQLDRRSFERVLDSGYTGSREPLPPWGENREVRRYYGELWKFLTARESGGLPPALLVPLRDE